MLRAMAHYTCTLLKASPAIASSSRRTTLRGPVVPSLPYSTLYRIPHRRYSRVHASAFSPSAVLDEDINAEGQPAAGYTDAEIREVDFDPRLVNSVGILGNLGQPFTLRRLQSGMCVASARVAVKNAKKESEWFDLEVWNRLAELAATQLQKGNQIQVVGRLKTETWTDKQGQTRKSVKIVADQVNRVKPYVGGFNAGSTYEAPAIGAPPAETWNAPQQAPPQQQQQDDFAGGRGQAFYDEMPPAGSSVSPPEQKWMDFFANPNAFWDNRVGKRNPRAPDFKQKDGDAALWLDSRDTPPWVHSQLVKSGLAPKQPMEEELPF